MVTVYDNGAKFVRYTIFTDYGRVYQMSSYPFSPKGFNQPIGEAEDFDEKDKKDFGRKLSLDKVPKQIKLAIEKNKQLDN